MGLKCMGPLTPRFSFKGKYYNTTGSEVAWNHIQHVMSLWQCLRVSICPYICQHLLLTVFCYSLLGMTFNLIMVWICISLMTNKVEHLFMCLLAPCISSFWGGKYIQILSLFSCKTSLYIPDISPSSGTNIFSHSMDCLFHFLDGVFWGTKGLNSNESQFI